MVRSVARLIGLMVGIGAACASFSAAQTPVPLPITGNLGTIAGSPQPYAGVLIQLQNCPSPVSVTGYMGIVATTYQLQANAAGLINGSVWPNDLITCNGTTGASQYSEVAVVGGVPSGTVQCYQVVSTQGVWNLNGQQQPIACAQTPPDPQDGFFRNLTSTGFFQGNNGAMSGTWTVNGLIYAVGGIQVGPARVPCSGSTYMTSLTNLLQPVCSSLPATPYLVSFNGRTTPAAVPQSGDYSYGQISGTPTVSANGSVQTQRPDLDFSTDFSVTDSASPAQTKVALANSGVTAGTCANPSAITLTAKGIATGCTIGVAPAARIIATKTFTSCALGNGAGGTGVDPDGGWSCSGTITWPSTLPDALYHTNCTLTYPNPYGSGTYNYSAASPTAFFLNPGTTTTTSQGYIIGAHQSGANNATFSMFCMAVE